MLVKRPIVRSLALAFGSGAFAAMFCPPVFSQQPVVQERVEITGSSLRRVDAETALPVTIIRSEDLIKQGVTNAEQALQRVAANQTFQGMTQAVGATTGGKSSADLRGLSAQSGGSGNKTLVLLNGHRLASHPYLGNEGSVDLNAIPIAAIDRIEVVRDGASATYGTDAIGGVINFILRRDYRGFEASAENQTPQKAGGQTNRVTLLGGFGSLDEQRFNLIASLDYRKQKVLRADQRDFARTGILGPGRDALTSGTSGTAFPGDLDGFEPSGPTCNPPKSMPRFTNPDNTGAFQNCRYDFTSDIDIIPENEQWTGLLRGQFQLTPSNVLVGEYLRAQNWQKNHVAPSPVNDLLPLSHPHWPVDPLTGLPVPTSIADVDPNTPGAQPGGVVNWREVPGGKRTSDSQSVTDRFLVELVGGSAGWDYRGTVGISRNRSWDRVLSGYLNDDIIQANLLNGLINPFGPQSAADQAAIDSAQINARTVDAKSDLKFGKAVVTRDLAQLPGGPLAAAFGIEYRTEKYSWTAADINAVLINTLGIDPDSDVSGNRHVSAAFTEFGIPIIKNLELTLSARYDKYSDFGSTFNPKVALRYQPVQQLLLRTSYNTGFRAPTLYDIYAPQSLTFTTNPYDDPLLCPGGTPVPGASAGAVCGQQVLLRQGGSVGTGNSVTALQPEKSKAWTLGFVLEPLRNVTFGVDFWWIRLRNQINVLPEQSLFGDPAKYAQRFVRCSQLAPGPGPGLDRSDIDVCLNFPAFDPIAFVDDPVENLGNLNTNGEDISLAVRFPTSSAGVFAASMDGTYVNKNEYQRERGGAFIQNVGNYADRGPIFRWQHVLALNWSLGPWNVLVANRFKTGYTDSDTTSNVASYSTFDLTATWTGVKNLTIMAGVLNILDKDPPFTVQATTFQRGYDPRFTDPRGRTWSARLSYKFL
jgi:iron complex outermembrane receptor protein